MTIQEIAEAQGLSVNTVRYHRGHVAGFPHPAGRRVVAGQRGAPPLVYPDAAVKAFYRTKEAASPQARKGPRWQQSGWDPDERLDARTAAARLKVNYSTFRTYPALYPAGGANPFPAAGQWAAASEWPPTARIGARTAAARLGLTYSDFQALPGLYAGDAGTFPAPGADRRYRWGDLATWASRRRWYRWGDLAEWDDRRPGSGRRDTEPRRQPARSGRRPATGRRRRAAG